MIYILNNLIEYNSDSGDVFRCGSDVDIVKLTPVLNHIFAILIENNDTVFSKDELLEKISSTYESTISINTLNQYISVLRKLLHQQLGIDNAILNISKKGLTLSSEIIVLPKGELNDVNKKTEQKNRVVVDKNPTLTYHNKIAQSLTHNGKIPVIILKTTIIILLIIVIFLSDKLYSSNAPYTPIASYKITKIGDCPVYTFKNDFQESIDSALDSHIKEFNLVCEPTDIFYYYNNVSNPGKNKNSLLVQCKKNKICTSTRINWQENHEK